MSVSTTRRNWRGITLLLALLLLAGCASQAGTRDSEGTEPSRTPAPDREAGREAEGTRPAPSQRGALPGSTSDETPDRFVGEGFLESDPSIVRTATGAGDPGDFDGEVITVVVNATHANASDSNPGTADQPLKTIGRAVELMAEKAGRDQYFHLQIHEATYREMVRIQGVKGRGLHLYIEGVGNPVISGAERYTGWTALPNGRYSHPWEHDWGHYFDTDVFKRKKASIPGGTLKWLNQAGDVFKRREAIFIDGEPVRQVLAMKELEPGTFYVDEAGDRLVLQPEAGVDPNAEEVEVAERLGVFQLEGAENVTLRNLTFRYASSYSQWPVAEIKGNDNILIEDVAFERGSYTGVELDNNKVVTLRRVNFMGNGSKGAGVGGNHHLLMEDCKASWNNWRGHWANTYAWAIAGMKGVYNRHVIVRRFTAENNITIGLWFDLDNVNITIEDCDLRDNQRHGLFLEAGRGPILVRDNRITGNRTHGLLIVNAERITARDNLVANNEKSQVFIRAYGREITSTWANVTEPMWSRYVHLYDNTFRSDTPSQRLWLTDMSKDNIRKSLATYEGNGNTWIHPQPAQAFEAFGTTHSWQEWKQWTGEGNGSVIRTP